MRRGLLLAAALLAPAAAHGFANSHDDDGNVLRWPAGTTIAVDIAAASDAGFTAARDAVTTYAHELERMGAEVDVADPRMVPALATSDDRITIEWVEEGWDEDWIAGALAVTFTIYDPHNGVIFGARVGVNARSFDWIEGGQSMDGCGTAFDLQTILTHELGHAFGLGHSEERNATMYRSAPPCNARGRTLANDDVLGLEAAYLPEPMVGCNVGAHGRGPGAALILILGLIATRLRRGLAGLVVAGVAVASSSPARATTLQELSIDDLGTSSAVVVRGLVASVSTVEKNGRVYTDTVLAVSECMKGPCGALLSVRQLGGVYGGVGTRVEGSAELAPGAEVVLCLRPRRDGAYQLTGMSQGAFAVERDATDIVALRRDVHGLVLVGEDGVARRDAAVTVHIGELRRAAQLP